jgi:hypothetical protein
MMGAGMAGSEAKGRKRFFLKKEAKTFFHSGARRRPSAPLNRQKFFGSFFQKRTLT